MTRNFWLLIHRWGGLVMAVPLIIVALTGSIIAFDKEMKHLLTPERYATPQLGVQQLDLETLAARAQALVPPEGTMIGLSVGPEHVQAVIMPRKDMAAMMAKMEKPKFSLSMLFSSDPGASIMEGLPFKPFVVYLDPWTGKELAREMMTGGALSNGVMRFIHLLHDNLALGIFGNWVLGLIALLWTLDCFISHYLTFPVSRRKDAFSFSALVGWARNRAHATPAPSPSVPLPEGEGSSLPSPSGGRAGDEGRTWWARWKPAWKIKTKASFYRLNFDLHRANGLWLWPMLFVFAWSSVQFNLKSVYDLVTGTVFEYQSPRDHMKKQSKLIMEKYKTHGESEPDVKAILATAKRLAAEEGTREGIALGEPQSYAKMPGTSLATLNLRLNTPTCRDITEAKCNVTLQFDSKTGTVVEFKSDKDELQNEPTGNFVTRWLRILHKGQTLGLWYQIFVSVLGIIITMLSVTGIYIWWKKRKARRISQEKVVRLIEEAGA